MREVTPRGLDFLIRQEGMVLQPYKDVAGYWTIGVGHLLTRSELASGKIMLGHNAVKWSGGLTEEQARHLLRIDLYQAESAIQTDAARLPDHQFDALVSLVFNIGAGAYRNSTLRRMLVAGQLDEVPKQMLRWDKAGGVRVPGLARRRMEEAALWTSRG